MPLATLLAGVLASGCTEEKKPVVVDAGVLDAGPKAALGGRLGAALAAAESGDAGAAMKLSSTSSDGPPDHGIFGPGAADRIMAKADRPRVQVLTEGAEPKFTPSLKLKPGASQPYTFTIAGRRGAQQRLPTMRFDVVTEVQKKKSDGADAQAEPGLRVLTKLKEIVPPEGSPKETADLLAKLKGSEFAFTVKPDGSAFDYESKPSKESTRDVRYLLRSVVDIVSLIQTPMPSKPVGVGATWMATDRATTFGMDTIRYRAVRVSAISEASVALKVEAREYAADHHFDAPFGPESAEILMEDLASSSSGSIEIGPGGLSFVKADMEKHVKASLTTADLGSARPFELVSTVQVGPPVAH